MIEKMVDRGWDLLENAGGVDTGYIYIIVVKNREKKGSMHGWLMGDWCGI